MCYSAQIEADYLKFLRSTGAQISIQDFVRLYWSRKERSTSRIPKALDRWFAQDSRAEAEGIRALIADYNAGQRAKLEQEVFKQRKRLADAERILGSRVTKAATDSKRIAADKIAWAMGKLGDLKRSESRPDDARIFPLWFAPVVVWQNGRRVVKPMRYQCRPQGKPAFYDTKYPGTYNARRDNLEGFWKAQFGINHGVILINSFYENVSRHRVERRELAPGEKSENVILEFRPQIAQPMFAACLWSHWSAESEQLDSFAAITDDPPPEIEIAGHDRCVIPLKPENIDAWLRCDSADLASYYAILDDRERPHYEYRMAA